MPDSLSLMDCFGEITDNRRGAGQRHSQTLVLTIAVMGIMSNYIGYRAIGDFIERNRESLLKYLQPPKDRLPSFDTVRRVLQMIDYDELNAAFHKWAKHRVAIAKNEWLQVDGKVIGGTVADACNNEQSFISLVSIYAARSKQAVAAKTIKHKKENELQAVQQLITQLDISGVTFSLDALHCQKKRQGSLLKKNAIMS